MIIDNIENIERYFSVLPGIREFIEALRNESLNKEKGEYPFSDGLRYINNGIEAHPDNLFEVHTKNIDVHIVMEGYERQEYSTQIYAVPKNYDSDKDIAFINMEKTGSVILGPGQFSVYFPREPHKPNLIADERKIALRKTVVKIHL